MLMCAVQYELNQNLFISKLTLRTNFLRKKNLANSILKDDWWKFQEGEKYEIQVERNWPKKWGFVVSLRWCEINVSFGSCIIHIGWTSITTKCGTRKTAQKRSRYICNRVWMCVFVCKIFKRLTTKRVCV